MEEILKNILTRLTTIKEMWLERTLCNVYKKILTLKDENQRTERTE